MRLLAVVLGAWAALIVAQGVAATLNFRAIETALATPAAERRWSTVAEPDRRALLRHAAGLSNRTLFTVGGRIQVALGALALALLWSRGGFDRGLGAALLVLALVQALWLTPALAQLGGTLDFVVRPLPAAIAGQFGRLHALASVADLFKLVGILWLAYRTSV